MKNYCFLKWQVRETGIWFDLYLSYIFLGAKDGIHEQIVILKRKSCCILVHLGSLFSFLGVVNSSNVVQLTL